MPLSIAEPLLAWYVVHGRRLPWRGARDPYRIWVSEIMLQQTRVETVIPYYQRWLKRLPSLRALAEAPEQVVLSLWEGLGYYSRARNLQRAAQIVWRERGGRLPDTVAELRALPGIGAYTAAAIASLAFGRDAAVLDGNVKRVLARLAGLRVDIKTGAGQRVLQSLADQLLPPGRAADYNQASMDLGALVCTPRAPDCGACPLQPQCAACRLGAQAELPYSAARAALPERAYSAAVIAHAGRVLLAQRATRLLGGLWSFPAAECAPADLPQHLRADWGLRIELGAWRQTLTHTFTHFRQTQQIFTARPRGPQPRRPDLRWARPAELDQFPMGKVDRQIARQLQSEA